MDSHHEQYHEHDASNCEERMIAETLRERDGGGIGIRKPMPSADRGTHGYDTEEHSPSKSRGLKTGYHFG